MKKLLLPFFIIFTMVLSAQSITKSQFKNIKVEDLSDSQISEVWEKAQDEGYTLSQLEMIAKAQGMSSTEYSKLRSRINNLSNSPAFSNNDADGEEELLDEENSLLEFGLSSESELKIEKNLIFGMDFFNNPNINFVPNLNVAAPDSYQLGPGDQVVIDVWGASEASYNLEVDRSGAIRVDRIGPIYVSGLSMKSASSKIVNYLKKIYRGIDADSSDVTKTYASVSLAKPRNISVNIIGEVSVPGTYNLSAMSSVINALYAAGGPTAQGSFRTIKLIRSGKEIENFDIYNYLKRGVFDKNIVLRDQDVLIIPAYENQISVFGAIRRPGFYELKQGESFEDLIFYTNGFTAEANTLHIAISRYNGKEREFIDLNYIHDSGTSMLNGDQVEVSKIVDRFTNRVQISGAVYSPGDFEYSNGLTVRDLIEKSNGLRDYASLDRALVYRNINDSEKEVLGFNLKLNMTGEEKTMLKANDSIVVFDKSQLREKYTITIDGAVNLNSTFSFKENMTVDDLVLQANGFKSGADLNRIIISRLTRTPDSDIMSINIVEKNADNTTILEPFDRVSVSYLKGYEELQNVTIQGKIAYPGTYSIETRSERISDLIDKAGGLLDEANSDGITIVRNITERTMKTQLKELEKVVDKDSLLSDKAIETTFRIGVDYNKILSQGKGSKYDVILEKGDMVLVPHLVSTVQVQGAVMSSSLVRYENSLSLKAYVNKSGGFATRAKKSKTYVIYANGDVQATKSFFGFKSYPKIKSGSIIVVPGKPEKAKMSTAELIGITSAITSLGVLVLTAIQN